MVLARADNLLELELFQDQVDVSPALEDEQDQLVEDEGLDLPDEEEGEFVGQGLGDERARHLQVVAGHLGQAFREGLLEEDDGLLDELLDLQLDLVAVELVQVRTRLGNQPAEAVPEEQQLALPGEGVGPDSKAEDVSGGLWDKGCLVAQVVEHPLEGGEPFLPVTELRPRAVSVILQVPFGLGVDGLQF